VSGKRSRNIKTEKIRKNRPKHVQNQPIFHTITKETHFNVDLHLEEIRTVKNWTKETDYNITCFPCLLM